MPSKLKSNGPPPRLLRFRGCFRGAFRFLRDKPLESAFEARFIVEGVVVLELEVVEADGVVDVGQPPGDADDRFGGERGGGRGRVEGSLVRRHPILGVEKGLFNAHLNSHHFP